MVDPSPIATVPAAGLIPAITVWQPWATLIAEGAKQYEFRSWPAPSKFWGARVAIHAGARPVKPDELRGLLLALQQGEGKMTGIRPEIGIPIIERALQAPKSLPLSSVLCTALLGRPLVNAALAAALGVDFVNDSDRDQHSNWGWPLSRIERVEPPAPARGSQGWWHWNPGEHRG